MKKFIISLIIIIFSLVLTGCSSAEHTNDPSVQSAIQMMRFDNPNFDEPFQR